MPRLPSPFAIYAAVVLCLFGVLTAVRGAIDADYYWHVTAGRLVAEGGVLITDPFSYTWQGQPWVMHEWLGQLIIWLLVTGVGFGVTAFLFGVISAAGPLLVAWTLHRQGLPAASVAIAASVVIYAFTAYATVRPQAISWLFIGSLVAGMIALRPSHRLLPWAVVPLIAVWANVHGLYVVGLGIAAVYVVFTACGATPMASRRWEMLALLFVAFGASMFTPAGPAGLLYPLRYLEAGDWGLRHIAEWQSPDFHDPVQLGFLLLVVAVLINGMRATPFWLATMAACGLVGGLLATRNVPIAAILALPTLAMGLASRLPQPIRNRNPGIARGRRIIELGVAGVVVAGAAAILPSLPALDARRAVPASFPVAAVDLLVEVAPDARVFAEYGWGGYVINRLFDHGGRVFVDGRNDMYDEAILEDFVTLRNADLGWEEILERSDTEAVLLPPAAPLVRDGLLSGEGWCEVHRDEVAVLLIPSCAGGPAA